MDKGKLRRLTLCGMAVEATFWLGFCAYTAFTVTTFIDFGYPAGTAAALVTVMQIVTMLVTPVLGNLTDRRISVKKLTIASMIITAACMFCLPLALSSGNMLGVIAVLTIFSLTGSQVPSLLDTWVVALKRKYPALNYGILRGSASGAYALSAFLMGLLTTALGHTVRLNTGASLLLVAISVCFLLEDPENTALRARAQNIMGREAVLRLIKNKRYVLLTGVTFLLIMCTSSLGMILQLLVPELGGNTSQIGLSIAIASGSELPVMTIMGTFIGRFGEPKLLIFASIIYAIRMFLTATVSSLNGLLMLQLLQALSYAVILPTAMSYLSHIVEPELNGTGVTLFTALGQSLPSVLGNALTSALIAAGHSTRVALFIFVGSSVCAIFLSVYGFIKKVWE